MTEGLTGGTPWAMEPRRFRTLLRAAEKRFGRETPSVPGEVDDVPDPEALAARDGAPLRGASRRVAVREGGVAVVPVVGPLFRRAGLLSSLFGGTPLDWLARDFSAALDASEVDAILLQVDSPGGTANGVSELSDMIFDTRGSGTRVVAHVGGFAASGAFWLASAASEVVVADTAVLGSIGVRAAFTRRERSGVRTVEVVSSQTPEKRPDVFDEEGRQEIQRVVDDLAAVMLDDLARSRSIPRDAVAERFGEGRLFVGREAVDRGLADRVATFEATVNALAEGRPTAAAGSEPPAPVEPESHHHQEAPVTTSASRREEHEDEDRAARLLVAAGRSEPPEQVELSPAPPVAPAAERGEAAEPKIGPTRGDGEARRAAAAIVEAARSGREAEGTGETARTALDREEEDAADDAAAAIVAASRRRRRKRRGG